MANQNSSVLYTGVTNNLIRRVSEHKDGLVSSFTSRYNVNRLVYFEEYDSSEEALNREKQIKGGSRKKKVELIKAINPLFKDLSEDF